MSEKASKSVRSRGPNFNKDEQLLLFSSMEPYTHIIECKKTDAIKQIAKQNAWSKVADVYNANTKGVKRTAENLLSCYRNAKSKMKKQHSEAKMLLADPNKREELYQALDENGKDWDVISNTINIPIEVCQSSLEELKKEVKRDDMMLKKKVLGTGGGPPPSHEDPLRNIKKYIDPQIDGMYTIYDGDADLMDQFQKSKPEHEQIQPIEIDFIDLSKENISPVPPRNITNLASHLAECGPSTSVENIRIVDKTPLTTKTLSRTDFLRKKRAPELENDYESHKKKKNVTDCFVSLSQEKLEIVHMQKKLLTIEIEHKKQMNALELEDKIRENEFKAEQRQKELYLLDLKIKKECQ